MKRNQAEKIFPLLEAIVFNDTFVDIYKTVHLAIIKVDHSFDDETNSFVVDDDYKIEIAFENFKSIKIGINNLLSSIVSDINRFLPIELEADEKPILVESSRPILQAKSFCDLNDNPYTVKEDFPNGGTSIINNHLHRKLSGSFGLAFKMNNHPGTFFISNFHVMARKKSNAVKLYETILHPSKADTYQNNISELNPIGTLYWFKIDEEADAAIALSNCEKSIGSGIRCNPDLKVKGIGNPKIGDSVFKCGRTTGLTEGHIKSDFCSVLIKDNYHLISDSGVRLFKNQILTDCMSCPGDSGSILINTEKYALGLLFAGDSKQNTYHNKLTNIFTKRRISCEGLVMPEINFKKFI